MTTDYVWSLHEIGPPGGERTRAFLHLRDCGCGLDPFAVSGQIRARSAVQAVALAWPEIHAAGGTSHGNAECVLAASGAPAPAWTADLLDALDGVDMSAPEKAALYRLARHADGAVLATLIRRARALEHQVLGDIGMELGQWIACGADVARAQEEFAPADVAMERERARDDAAARVCERLRAHLVPAAG
ncbi:hypothetical protein [Planomonospora sp. ID82291]|uniref:hypothetical protein n=1 Tax=Planomonospora sp. ID82291 TaxID=2738136 RepID=UPI0018C3C805|nr:hypothetical protein [Planomonospora sp. ID82291]MBG0818266.1 hypothetical protein [Planomonospora sp. ID82291]